MGICKLPYVLVFSMLCGMAAPALAEQDFSAWLQDLRKEAAAKGISQATLDAALTGIEPIPRVIELDRKQPEFTLTFDEYMQRVVPEARVEKGRKRLAENRKLLEEVSRKYGVQPQFIVAFWGIETDFGRVTGGFKVVPALATLAHDGRRSAYFRKELFDALTILDGGHIKPDDMVGSWAGAMGQPQFMPSSFVRFAVDGNGDGRKDIWNSKADVFASAANYLSRSGWRGDERWGRQVTLPKGFDLSLADENIRKPVNDWAALGITRANGAPLPKSTLEASLVMPVKDKGPAFLVYNNYRVILKWNRSHFFALAVGRLADRIAGG